MVHINRKGTIRSGKNAGWTVVVQDDTKNTGGYLILLQGDLEGYDDWVQDLDSLEKYLQEAHWDIDWGTP